MFRELSLGAYAPSTPSAIEGSLVPPSHGVGECSSSCSNCCRRAGSVCSKKTIKAEDAEIANDLTTEARGDKEEDQGAHRGERRQ